MARKVTFVKGSRETVVWDAENKCPLAEFHGGLFVTTDPRTIEILQGYGYRTVNDFPDGPPAGGFTPQKPEAADLDTGNPKVNVRTSRTEAQDLLKHNLEHESDADDPELPEPETRTPGKVGRKVPRKVTVKNV